MLQKYPLAFEKQAQMNLFSILKIRLTFKWKIKVEHLKNVWNEIKNIHHHFIDIRLSNATRFKWYSNKSSLCIFQSLWIFPIHRSRTGSFDSFDRIQASKFSSAQIFECDVNVNAYNKWNNLFISVFW